MKPALTITFSYATFIVALALGCWAVLGALGYGLMWLIHVIHAL